LSIWLSLVVAVVDIDMAVVVVQVGSEQALGMA
jgi:hypothetical protein